MKTSLLLASLSLALGLVQVHATVTLQISTASNKLTNIQNALGTASGGLRWGIVVDTNSNGFHLNGTNYDGFTFPSVDSGVFLAEGATSTATDDFFYWHGQSTVASVGGTDGGSNAMTGNFIMPLGSGVSAGDPFGLIWFDTTTTNDGDKYGFLTISSGADPFTIPSDGSTVSYSPNFAGADPVRLAGNTLGAIVVPEPSRILLLCAGLVGLLIRRRR